MKKLFIVLLAVVVLFSSVMPKQFASADGLTLAAIASSAYAIASASGLNFGFTGYDGAGVSQWMQNRINSWLAGRTVAEAFGDEAIRLTAGKLLIPSAAVAGITLFLGDLKDKLGLSENMQNEKLVNTRIINGQIVLPSGLTFEEMKAYAQPCITSQSEVVTGKATVLRNVNGTTAYYTGYGFGGLTNNVNLRNFSTSQESYGWVLQEKSPVEQNKIYITNLVGVTAISREISTAGTTADGGNITADIPGTYIPPEGLNDLQSWEGTVADAPDTNIEDLLADIFDKIAQGSLDVSGEVVDTPVEPQVTPVPTAAPGDIIGGLDTISGQLEGIDETLTGVQEGVGEAVGQLEGINEGIGSISEALDVPTTSEAPAFKFDLTTLFPFCIPFDIYRFVTMFSASPVAPHVQIPFNIPAVGLQYTFDLDFSSFDGVASVLRSVELIAFCVGLAILTSKVIRW